MSRFLRLGAFLSVLFFATNVFAAGYSCPTYKKYTSCNTGYYMTFNGTYNGTPQVGNACTACPSGCTCSAGTGAPVCRTAGTTTVNKTTISLTYPTTSTTFTASCSGGATPTATSNATGVATVSMSGGTGTVTWKSAGTATITVNCPQTTSYYASSKTISVSTYNGTITVSASNKTLTYTGSAQSCGTVSVTAPSSGAAVKYGTSNGSYTSTSAITKTTAGTYTIYYQVTASNYTTKTGSFTCTVNKAAGTTTVSKTSMTLTYPTTTGTFTASCSESGAPTATSNATSTATVSISSGTATVTWKAAGSATITVSCPATTNYNESSKTVAVTIAKGTNTLTLSATSGTLTYNASTKTKTFTVSKNTSGGTLSVSSNATGVATASISGSTVTATYVKVGSATITVSSAATSYYNAASATYVLTINCGAGYYSNSAACTICPMGKYTSTANTASSCTNVNAGCYADTTGSTTACPKSCSSLGGGLYGNSVAGSDSQNDCYFTTTAGQYLVNATDTAQTLCDLGHYCPATTLYYPNTGGRNSCPDPTTHSDNVADMTGWLVQACSDATASNTTILSVGLTLWAGMEGQGSISGCRANYVISTPCADYRKDSVSYNSSTGLYDTYVGTTEYGDRYSATVKPGYYFTERYGASYCDYAIQQYYKAAAKCPAGSYCPSATAPLCSDGEYKETFGSYACTSLGSFYTTSSAGATAATACSGKTTAGKFVKTANSGEEACTCGGYCPGSVSVNYGSTGGKTDCGAGTYNNATSSSASSACKTTSAGYYAAAGSCSQTQVNANCWGAAGSKVACPNACASPYSTSAKGSDDANDCYLTTTSGNYVATAGAGQVTCAVGGYCPGGSTIYKGGSVSGRSTIGGRTACALGSYTDTTGKSACTACQSGTTTSGTGKTSCDATCANNNSYDNAWATATWTANSVSNLCKISNCKAGSSYSSSAGTNYTGSCTACEKGKYMASSAHTNTSCSACSSLSGVSVSGGTYTTASTGSTASTACTYTAPSKTITGCSSVSTNTVTYSGSAWPATTYNVSASGGYIIANNGTASATCSQCSGGTYSAGGSATSCSPITDGCYGGAGASTACPNNCNALTAPAVTGGTFSSVTPRSANTACRYVAPSKTDNECSSITANTVSYSGSAWGTNFYTALAKAGSRVTATGNTSAPACALCVAGTYQGTEGSTATSCPVCGTSTYSNAGASSCTACATDKGYANSGTNASDHAGVASCKISCIAGYYVPKAGEGCKVCAAGKYCTAKSGIAQTETSAVTGDVKAGYFASAGGTTAEGTCLSGYSCGSCSSGTGSNGRLLYSNAGASSCSECPAVSGDLASRVKSYSGWWSNNIHNSIGGCYAHFSDTDDTATFDTLCYYNSTDKAYGGTNSSCQTYKPSACAGGYYSVIESATEWRSGGYAACEGVDCMKGKVCGKTDAGYYSADGATTQTACATGSYTDTKGQSECKVCSEGKTTSGTGKTSCDANCSNASGVYGWETPSWSANTVSNLCTVAATAGCSANYYKSSNACLTCSSGTNSKYTLSAAGTTSVNSCYLKTTAGKYVATKGAGETACVSPYYCTGGTTIYYGTGTTTGGNSACTGLGAIYTASDASASVNTKCYATTSPGKYVTAKATSEATCPAGDWCAGSVKVYYGSAGGNTDCPSGYTNGTTGYSQQSQCLMSVAGGKYVATPTESSASGTCDKGYAKEAHTVNYGSTSSCSACTGARYQDATGQASCKICPNSSETDASATGVYGYNTSDGIHDTVTGCYATFKKTVTAGTIQGNCYSNASGVYGRLCDGFTGSVCNGGYYYSGTGSFASLNAMWEGVCTAVGAGYYFAGGGVTWKTAHVRGQCDTGLTTIGYGVGANEAGDCGRKFHAGDNVIYLRSEKRGDTALNVKIGNQTFFGALSTTYSSPIKVKNGSTTYSVVNDWQ